MEQLGKDVLAAYFNDARLNILYCLNDIRSKTLQLEPFENEDQIITAFRSLNLEKRSPEVQRDIIKQLRNRFRFLDVLLNAEPRKEQGVAAVDSVFLPTPSNYYKILDFLFTLIQDLRSSMVHPMDEESSLDFYDQRRLSIGLTKVYASARVTVKKRFNVDTKTIEKILLHAGRNGFKSVNRFSLAICNDPKNNQQKISKYHSQVLHDFGYVLLCSLFLDKSQSASLIAKFWEVGHSKFWDTDYQKIIKEMISVYRVWLPMRQVKTTDDKTAVTVDTLTELSSCPRQLIDRLKIEDRERFRTGDPEETDNAHDDDSFLMLRGRNNRFVPLIMRYFDFDSSSKLRFAIDLGHYYYNVRYKLGGNFPADGLSRERRLGKKMVAYGRLANFCEDNKPKSWRTLESNYHKVGKEIEQLDLNKAKDIEQLSPYIVQTYSHYHFSDDKIGFRLSSKAEENGAYPELPDNNAGEKPDSAKGKNMLPDFWINQSQLLQLAFYNYLQKSDDSHQAVDIFLSKYRVGMKAILTALDNNSVDTFDSKPDSPLRRQQVQAWVNQQFSKGINVSLGDMPKVIVHHLVSTDNRKIEKTTVVKRVASILATTKAKREHTKRRLQSNVKHATKTYRPIKCGEIADFLTDDLLRFQPIDKSKIATDGGKLNSQEYQILQSTLAYYGVHIDKPPRIVDLLSEFGLLTGDFKHPFLEDLKLLDRPDKYQGILSFYDAYLQARIKFLDKYLKGIESSAKIDDVPKWLRIRKPSSLKNWLKDYKVDGQIMAKPLPVPRHLFYQPLLNMVATKDGMTPEELEKKGMQSFTRDGKTVEVKPASNWFIKYYLEQAHDDQPQQMYREYERSHRLFDSYFDKRTAQQMRQAKETLYYSEAERKGKLKIIQKAIKPLSDNDKQKQKYTPLLSGYKRSERAMTHSSIQDMVLYLYAREKLEENVLEIPTENLKLKSIEHTLLNTPFDIALPVPDSDKSLLQKDCKIKTLGKFRLLLQDRRLKTLMPYYPENESVINADEIRAELKSYQQSRISVMKKVHQLEKLIVNCCDIIPSKDNISENHIPSNFKKVFTGRHGIYLYELYKHFANNSEAHMNSAFDTQAFVTAKIIRNKFSHNQYPLTEDFTKIKETIANDAIPDNPSNNRKIAKRLFEILEALYQPWLEYLEQETGETNKGTEQ